MLFIDLAAAALAIGGPFAPPPPSSERAATVTSLSPAQMFLAAEKAEASGNVRLAKTLLRALFDDRDVVVRQEARFRLAMVHARHGERQDAAVHLRRLVDEVPGAQRARLELSMLLAAMGEDAAARKELRALAAGPLPADAARVIDRFASALEARRPVGGSFSIAVAPDSNINRATRSDRLGTVIGDFLIDDSGRSRSGVGMALATDGFVRHAVGQGVSLVGRVQGQGRLYRHGEFNDVSIGVRTGAEFNGKAGRLTLELAATRRWFGGKRYADIRSLSADAVRAVSPTVQVRGSLGAADVRVRRNPLESGMAYSGTIGLDKAFGLRTGAGATLMLGRRTARDDAFAHHSADVSIYGWRDFGRVTLVGSVGAGRLDADERLALYPDKRRDRSWRASLGATFRQLTLFGFAPSLSATQERNRSSIEIYDYRRRAFELTFRRAF